jgi:protein tyrosine/serine phosphatase
MLGILFVSALYLGAAPSLVSVSEQSAQRIEGLGGVSNVALVAPGLYRGGTPTREGIASLSKLGVKTIVSLRHYHTKSEARDAKKAGINYVWLPIPSSGEPSDDTLRRFLAVVQDPTAQPVYVHCWRGKDRTGAMIASYRILIDGWPRQDAVAEMQAFGFFKGWIRLRGWVDRLEEKTR